MRRRCDRDTGHLRDADTPDRAKLLNPRTGKPGVGYSMIFGPDGRKLADAIPEDEEGILYAELDPAMIAIAKAAADPVGHYARPDVLGLWINRSRRSVMHEIHNEAGGHTEELDDGDVAATTSAASRGGGE